MKELSPRAFLLRLIAAILAILLFAGAAVVLIDPYFHYRLPQTELIIADRFCMPGLADYMDYNSVLIGSSMCQNFDMDKMEEDLGGNFLKAVKGGMTPGQAREILGWISEAGRAERVYLSLDLVQFNKPEPEEYYPSYLTNDQVFDDVFYLYGYEAWMRYLPLDVLLLIFDGLNLPTPKKLQSETDPDAIGNWAQRAKYPGEEKLIENYLSGSGSVSAQNTDGMFETMKAAFDSWLSSDPFDEDTEYHIFTAPYSALYWAHTARDGSLDEILSFRTYFFSRLSEYDNVILYDFVAIDEIRDLSLYKDISHYHESVNEKMTDLFAAGETVRTTEEVAQNNDAVMQAVEELQEKYPALLPA